MKNLYIWILLLLGFSNLLSQSISYNEEFQVNTSKDGSQNHSTLASLTNGGFVICWENEIGVKDDIYAQLFANNGEKLGSEFKINSDNYTNKYPKVTSLDNDRFVVCWNSYEMDTNYSIKGQIFTNSGLKIGNEISIGGYNSSVSKLSNGGFVITWDKWVGIDEYDIFVQVYDSNGISISDEIRANSFTQGWQDGAKTINLSNSKFVVCWTSRYPMGGAPTLIKAQIFNEDGTFAGNEIQVNSHTYSYQNYTNITSLTNGDFVIFWGSNEEYNSDLVFMQMLNNVGQKIGEQVLVNSEPYGQLSTICATSLSNAEFVVCWDNKIIDPGYKSRTDIILQIFDNEGLKIGEQVKANLIGNSSFGFPSISNYGTNKFVVCWSKYSDGQEFDIWGNIYPNEHVYHNLINFSLTYPEFDEIITLTNPKIIWRKANTIKICFPWELTYDLYIDNNENFTNPLIYTGIQDTIFQIDSLTPGNTYFWKVLARNYYGDTLWSSNVNGFYVDPDAISNIIESNSAIPEKFELFQNYPNPFNPTTKIKYSLPIGKANYNVSIKVYDILGRIVAVLFDDIQQPGNYKIKFNANGLTSGLYFYTVHAGKFNITKKMIILR